MKNRDGSDSNVKFVSKSTKNIAKGQKQQKKVNSVKKKTANRGMVSDAYRKALAKAIAKGATDFKGIERLSDQDISRQFSVARGMVDSKTIQGLEQGSGRKKKKTNPVAKGFAQDKRIRADKAKEKKAFSK